MPGPGPIYLDHNATTPIAPEVAAAMWPDVAEHFGNPSSDHPIGRAAKAAVDIAREKVAALVGAHPDEVVFTSGGTEANNLAILGTAAGAATPFSNWWASAHHHRSQGVRSESASPRPHRGGARRACGHADLWVLG